MQIIRENKPTINISTGRACIILIFILVLFFLTAVASYAQTVIFFDPDNSSRMVGKALTHGNRFFKKANPSTKFIIITNEAALESEIEALKPQVMIINSQYYSAKKESLSLTPFFVFTSNRATSYNKKLISINKKVTTLDDLTNKVLSLAQSGDYIFAAIGVNKGAVKILPVSKDIDAILALKFNQADAALVSDAALVLFSKNMPQDYQQVNVIKSVVGIRHPLIVTTRYSNNSAFIDKLKQLIAAMKNDEDGIKLLQIIQFDGVKGM
jgi:hypothetical protein